MDGAFSLNNVYDYVTLISPGAYILSRDGETAHYVGRSDTDVGVRISQSKLDGYGYRHFWFQYAPSPMTAYFLECEWYHKYNPPDNTVHPAVPFGTNLVCPVGGCGGSSLLSYILGGI